MPRLPAASNARTITRWRPRRVCRSGHRHATRPPLADFRRTSVDPHLRTHDTHSVEGGRPHHGSPPHVRAARRRGDLHRRAGGVRGRERRIGVEDGGGVEESGGGDVSRGRLGRGRRSRNGRAHEGRGRHVPGGVKRGDPVRVGRAGRHGRVRPAGGRRRGDQAEAAVDAVAGHSDVVRRCRPRQLDPVGSGLGHGRGHARRSGVRGGRRGHVDRRRAAGDGLHRDRHGAVAERLALGERCVRERVRPRRGIDQQRLGDLRRGVEADRHPVHDRVGRQEVVEDPARRAQLEVVVPVGRAGLRHAQKPCAGAGDARGRKRVGAIRGRGLDVGGRHEVGAELLEVPGAVAPQHSPITSNGSPYSSGVQLDEYATGWPSAVHLRLDAWWRPMLWPSSCATTRVEMPFIQDCVPGSSPSPAQPPQLACWGKT